MATTSTDKKNTPAPIPHTPGGYEKQCERKCSVPVTRDWPPQNLKDWPVKDDPDDRCSMGRYFITFACTVCGYCPNCTTSCIST
mmetsp:Transcript_16647/g.18515  ORF Transcript_16647/g.18515 Transcript_16647/m.18515 type:complete len:84 (+) Transcript_16647:43-294(+)